MFVDRRFGLRATYVDSGTAQEAHGKLSSPRSQYITTTPRSTQPATETLHAGGIAAAAITN